MLNKYKYALICKKVGKSGEKWGIFCIFALKTTYLNKNTSEISWKHRGKG